jgi:hypothetical protein
MRLSGGWGFAAAALACVALAGCETPRYGCAKAGMRATAELVFGRSSDDPAHPSVSEADFTRFLNEEVTPRFPDGLTVIDAQGRWSAPAGNAVAATMTAASWMPSARPTRPASTSSPCC